MTKNRKGYGFMALGLLLLMASLGLTIKNINEQNTAFEVSQEILNELVETMSDEDVQIQNTVDYTSMYIDGYDYIGIIEIPSVGMCLPVMTDWDYTKLKIGPCRYVGSYYTDDMVLMSHNYSKQFNLIKRANVGDDVYFTTVNNVEYHYKVAYAETLQPNQVEEMTKKTDWDLSLFTCNLNGVSRYVIRCVRA